MNNIFFEIECLTEFSRPLKGEYLRKNWFKKADKRYLSQYLQKFKELNRIYFEFLGVSVFIEGSDPNVALRFESSKYIGAIPLRRPDTGKQMGDFVVSPRYSSKDKFLEYIKILNLIEDSVDAEFKTSLPLMSARKFHPPFYFEAILFIKDLTILVNAKWLKFANNEELSDYPTGQVNWKKYLASSFKVENNLSFPVSKNILSEYHQDYEKIKYVFDLCKRELLGSQTPEEIRVSMRHKLRYLEEKLRFHDSTFTKNIQTRQSDTPLIAKLKHQANKILSNSFTKSIAWKVDFNAAFEKYAQYLFEQISKEIGGRFFRNYKIKTLSNRRFQWELRNLEPDGVLVKEGQFAIFIDAKYKSHLLNKYSASIELRDEYRRDLHQLVAYTSFSNQATRYGFLCYPSNLPEIKDTEYINPLTSSRVVVSIIGIPLNTNYIQETKKMILDKLSKINKQYPKTIIV